MRAVTTAPPPFDPDATPTHAKGKWYLRGADRRVAPRRGVRARRNRLRALDGNRSWLVPRGGPRRRFRPRRAGFRGRRRRHPACRGGSVKAHGALWTPLCDLLGIRHALLLAGMAGGPNTPELVSEVSRSRRPGRPRRDRHVGRRRGARDPRRARARRRRPRRRERPTRRRAARRRATPSAIAAVLAPFRAELGLPPESAAPRARRCPAGAARGRRRRRRLGHHDVRGSDAGDPACAPRRDSAARDGHDSPADAVRAVAAGADGVIAQGTRGGRPPQRLRRGRRRPQRPEVGTLALVPQVVDAVGPGSARRRDAAASWTGAASPPRWRSAPRASRSARASSSRARAASPTATGERSPTARADGTVVTDALTRPPRALDPQPLRGRPRRRAGRHARLGRTGRLIADIRRAAAAQERVDLLPMLAGQGAALAAIRSPPPRSSSSCSSRQRRRARERASGSRAVGGPVLSETYAPPSPPARPPPEAAALRWLSRPSLRRSSSAAPRRRGTRALGLEPRLRATRSPISSTAHGRARDTHAGARAPQRQ